MKDKLITVGRFKKEINSLLGTDFEECKIVRSQGLLTHLIKRKHFDSVKYIDYIPEIIAKPDYIGFDRTEGNKSLLYIKKYDRFLYLSVKVDEKKQYMYVSTFLCKEERKIARMIFSKKIIPYVDNID